MKVFLGAPIQYASDNNGLIIEKIRGLITNIIRMMEQERHEVFSAHVAEEYGKNTERFQDSEICERDYLWMTECDRYIAFFPNNQENRIIHSAGTNIELGWAVALKKEIIIIYDFTKKQQLSKLVRGLKAVADVTFLNLTEIREQPEILLWTLQNQVSVKR